MSQNQGVFQEGRIINCEEEKKMSSVKAQNDLLIRQIFVSFKSAISIVGWGQKPGCKIVTVNIDYLEVVHEKI